MAKAIQSFDIKKLEYVDQNVTSFEWIKTTGKERDIFKRLWEISEIDDAGAQFIGGR